MTLFQFIILITGPVGFYMALRDKRHGWRSKLGLAITLAGQPFWLYESHQAGQWGFFIVSILWSYVWGKALWEEWKR